MTQPKTSPNRFVGLDVHKRYLVAAAVDSDRNEVMSPRRVLLTRLDTWVQKPLTVEDAVVLEMTTNSFQIYDDLLPHVHSVTVVHPPHVALITRAQVMTDEIAARILAKLHAAGLLPSIWVPPLEVRDHRAPVAQRSKILRLSTQAKNRLHAVLHRHHLRPPEGDPFVFGQDNPSGRARQRSAPYPQLAVSTASPRRRRSSRRSVWVTVVGSKCLLETAK